jgi:Ran GTPase-activating protein (RanGAP) involved in mRNA processing and transport
MKINLFAGGARCAVQPEEADSMLERFRRQSEGNTVYKVDLSCRQWKRESLDKLVPFLQNISESVQFLNLADVIAGLMTDEGLGVTELLAQLFEKSNLLEIELSDNAMGECLLRLYVCFEFGI